MNRLLPPCAALLLVALPALAPAQRHGREPAATFFEKANYRGESMTLYPGMSIDNLDHSNFSEGRRANDRISSVLIEGDVEVLAYEHANFRGRVLRLTGHAQNLDQRPLPDTAGTWNDRISSIEVREIRGSGRGRDRDRPREEDPDVIIKRAYQDILGRDPDPEGRRHYRGLIIDQGWTERMVRDHMRKGDEYRGPAVDRIIKRAYNDLLNRDPDPSGLQTYRRLILEKNWTEAQVRDAIRAGDEYKNRGKPAPPSVQPVPREERRDPEHGDNRPDR